MQPAGIPEALSALTQHPGGLQHLTRLGQQRLHRGCQLVALRNAQVHPLSDQRGDAPVQGTLCAAAQEQIWPRQLLPQIVQTDNGGEFCHTAKTKRVHPLDLFCQENGITHKTNRPRTPWHNGKVERSHRNDQERFYNHLSFYSFDDLQLQMKRYLRRSNDIPMSVLGWKSPNTRQRELSRDQNI